MAESSTGEYRGISFAREAFLTVVIATLLGAFWQVNPGFVEYESGTEWEWQRSLGTPPGDSPYHIRMAYLYRTGEAFEAGPNFHWTRISVWNGTFSDKDFLYHVALIPFTYFAQDDYDHGGLMQGAKIAAAAAWGVLALALLCALRMLGVRPAWMYVFLVAALSWAIQARMMETRNWFLSTSFALLGWASIVRGRYALLFSIGVLYTLCYTASAVLIALGLFHTVGSLVLGPMQGATRKSELARNLKLTAMAALGVMAGWALHPQPLELLKLWWVQNILVVYMHNGGEVTGIVGEITRLMLGWKEIPPDIQLPPSMFGAELRPPGKALLWQGFGTAMFFPIVPIALAAITRWRPGRTEILTMVIAVPLLVMIVRSTRFCEYGIPFVALATGLWFTGMARSARVQGWLAGGRERVVRVAGIGILVAGFLAQAATIHLKYVYVPATFYPKMVAWLSTHDEVRGKMIYNTGWGSFPELFIVRSDCDYAAGLDPAFVAAAGTPQSRAFINISLGQYEKVAPHQDLFLQYLRDEMGADYVFVVNAHNRELYEGFLLLAQAGKIELLVRDREEGYCLYRLK